MNEVQEEIQPTEVIMIKLVSGDVILGKGNLDDLGEVFITIDKPMQLMLDPTQGGVGMIPYDAIYTQQESDSQEFRSIDVMHTLEVHETFEEAYIKQTTGIETQLPEIELGGE